MVRFLSWNARGLGSSSKRRALKDTLTFNNIDIVGIQETKKESFTTRTLTTLSHSITHWITKCATGASGGLLLGLDDSKFSILDSWIMEFSITVHIKNKFDDFEWILTTVYGPVLSNLRNNFLSEIYSISLIGPSTWLIFGD